MLLFDIGGSIMRRLLGLSALLAVSGLGLMQSAMAADRVVIVKTHHHHHHYRHHYHRAYYR